MVPRGGGSPSDPALGGERAGWGGTPAGVPGVELRLGALGVLLLSSLLFGFLAFCVVRRAGGLERQRRWLGLLSCFACGVFLATCLLDLLPDYLEGMTQACNTAGLKVRRPTPSPFPLPEFIMAMGFFLVLVLEQIVLAFKDPGPAPASEDRRSLLVDANIKSRASMDRSHSHCHQGEEGEGGGHLQVDVTSRSALRAFILVFSLSLHSVFEGLAVGLLGGGARVVEVCAALLLHKSVVSFSLSLKLVQARLRRPVVASGVLLFAATSPLGVGLGLLLTETRASPQHLMARSTLEGVAAGTFLYITFLEILPHELISGRDRLARVGALLLGFSVVTGALFIQL
uniref:Solute carrier family 39 member 1 n=1 Tax=Gadus morhua TaxID=8049 RepID=A0A8C4ZLC5_GADMO